MQRKRVLITLQSGVNCSVISTLLLYNQHLFVTETRIYFIYTELPLPSLFWYFMFCPRAIHIVSLYVCIHNVVRESNVFRHYLTAKQSTLQIYLLQYRVQQANLLLHNPATSDYVYTLGGTGKSSLNFTFLCLSLPSMP